MGWPINRWGHLSAKRMPISQVVDILAGQWNRPVTDLTKIRGIFDVTLDWTPESAGHSRQQAPSTRGVAGATGSEAGEARKSPIEVIVVDHAEKASEN